MAVQPGGCRCPPGTDSEPQSASDVLAPSAEEASCPSARSPGPPTPRRWRRQSEARAGGRRRRHLRGGHLAPEQGEHDRLRERLRRCGFAGQGRDDGARAEADDGAVVEVAERLHVRVRARRPGEVTERHRVLSGNRDPHERRVRAGGGVSRRRRSRGEGGRKHEDGAGEGGGRITASRRSAARRARPDAPRRRGEGLRTASGARPRPARSRCRRLRGRPRRRPGRGHRGPQLQVPVAALAPRPGEHRRKDRGERRRLRARLLAERHERRHEEQPPPTPNMPAIIPAAMPRTSLPSAMVEALT